MSLKKYLSRKLSIPKARLSQILPNTHLPNVFRHHLSEKVDLRPNMTPVEDQLHIGCSVTNCLTGAYEYLTKKSDDYNTNVSRLFIYYNARVRGNKAKSITDSGCSMTDSGCSMTDSGCSMTDSGCSMTDAIEALEEFGTCLESLWPYDASNVNVRPSDEAYEQAEHHKIDKALRINVDLIEMKSCLAQGFPIAFGLKLFSSFDKVTRNGVVEIPNEWEEHRQLKGSHAMLAVGYSDRLNAFIVRNSWGKDWGDGGYCYIPYDYMTNSDLCFDLWTIRKVANSDFGREYRHCNGLVTIESVDGNDEETNIDDQERRRYSYYHRQSQVDDSWEQYRHYQDNPLSRPHDDYLDSRSRRDRYDRDNEPYDHHFGVHNFHSNRSSSYSYYDRHQEDSNYQHYVNDDYYYTDQHRQSTF